MGLERARVRFCGPCWSLRRWPRHFLLGAYVAGLVAGPLGTVATVSVAAAGAVAAGGWVGAGGAGAVLLGGRVAELRQRAVLSASLPAAGVTVDARAVVLEPPRRRRDGRAVMRAAPVASLRGDVLVRLPPAARGPALSVGEIVGVRGRVGPLPRWERWQRRRGVAALLDAVAVTRTGARRGGPAGALDAIRTRAERGLDAGLRPPESALLRGMILGQDERITQSVREDFRRSGLAHILAVSGQNVALLAALVFGVGAIAGLGLRGRLVLALALVALYVPLAGGGPSIQRAGVMGAAGLVAALAGRPSSRVYALILAAAVTLTWNPLAATDPGWQLSFAAVVAMLVLAPRLTRAGRSARLPEPLAVGAAITVAAGLGTAPLLALHFGTVSLASLPANLLALPAIAPAMWLGMSSAAVAQVEPAAAAFLNAANAPLLAFLMGLARWAGQWPAAVVSPAIAGAFAAAAAVTLLGVRLARRSSRPARTTATLGLIGAAAALVAWSATRPPGPPDARVLVVSFLDVGQGDATLLQHGGRSLLVDTGPPEGPVLERLRAAGVRRLDALVLTHAQADHDGAAADVIARHAPRLLLDGGPVIATRRPMLAAARRVGARRLTARGGLELEVGGVRVRLLWPPPTAPPPGGDPNDRAVVAHARWGAFDLLLPADAESHVTAALDLPAVDVLKVAHHGSADAGLPALLDRLRPRIAVLMSGRGNPYGHPAPSTLAALRRVPRVLRTDRDGTVRLVVRGGRMEVETAR